MTQDQAPQSSDPADPVVGTPEEVAAAPERDPGGAVDPNEKFDTTREAAGMPTD